MPWFYIFYNIPQQGGKSAFIFPSWDYIIFTRYVKYSDFLSGKGTISSVDIRTIFTSSGPASA
jgi:hypothetical protein